MQHGSVSEKNCLRDVVFIFIFTLIIFLWVLLVLSSVIKDLIEVAYFGRFVSW